MHGGDVAHRAFERPAQCGIECVERGDPAFTRHLEPRQRGTVKIARVSTQGLVAVEAYIVDDGRGARANGRVE